MARPPIAVPRLSLSSTGKVVYTLKTPYRDGTTQVGFEGAAIRTVDFIARLAALVAKPRVKRTGTPSPGTMACLLGAAIRLITAGVGWSLQPSVVRQQRPYPTPDQITRRTPYGNDLVSASCDAPLKRVFNIDIEVCSRCGGSVKVIVEASNRCIEDQDIIDQILVHLRRKEQDSPIRPLLLPGAR